jgi:hypothetical protein
VVGPLRVADPDSDLVSRTHSRSSSSSSLSRRKTGPTRTRSCCCRRRSCGAGLSMRGRRPLAPVETFALLALYPFCKSNSNSSEASSATSTRSSRLARDDDIV